MCESCAAAAVAGRCSAALMIGSEEGVMLRVGNILVKRMAAWVEVVKNTDGVLRYERMVLINYWIYGYITTKISLSLLSVGVVC